MIMQNTRESALRRDEFHRVLRQWLDDSMDESAGDADSHAGPAWLWVRHGGNHFYLHANTTRSGVREYLRIVEEHAGEPAWAIHETGTNRDRVAVGLAGRVVDGFEFFRHVPPR